jgi:integrase
MMAKARRGNGEGSIYQRANGQWCATYAAGYDSSGKRRRRTIFANTKEEILTELAKKQSEKLAGQLNEPTRLRLGAYLDRWLEDASRPTIRATTYESYKGIIKNHLKPHVGGILLGKLGPAHVQGLYSEMERGGASARTRQLTHAVLRKVVQERLGHSQIGITLDIYSHVLPGMQADAATRLNGLMQPAKAKRKAK